MQFIRANPEATMPEAAESRRAESRSEQQLIAAILSGERHLYHELVRPVEKKVFMIVLACLNNSADAEDVVQEAFLEGFRHLASFRGEAKFSSWITTIALNKARARLRQSNTHRELSLDDTGDEDHAPAVSPAMLRDWREIPSEALERGEVRELIRRAVEALPASYRSVFLLREMEHLSGEETAAALGISHALVKVRLHRARLMLQQSLAPTLRQTTQPHRKRRWPF